MMEEVNEFDFENRFMTNEYDASLDSEVENSLRPKTLEEYVGQVKAKSNLKVYIESAKLRGEPLDHVLLHGPPGLGKTTLASIIANEMGVNIRKTSGPAIEKPKDLAALLTNLNDNDILFVDEIRGFEYSENGTIDMTIGEYRDEYYTINDLYGYDLNLGESDVKVSESDADYNEIRNLATIEGVDFQIEHFEAITTENSNSTREDLGILTLSGKNVSYSSVSYCRICLN